MRKILLLTIAVLTMALNVNAENVPYAEYKNGTLTFKYGDIESSSCQFASYRIFKIYSVNKN